MMSWLSVEPQLVPSPHTARPASCVLRPDPLLYLLWHSCVTSDLTKLHKYPKFIIKAIVVLFNSAFDFVISTNNITIFGIGNVMCVVVDASFTSERLYSFKMFMYWFF